MLLDILSFSIDNNIAAESNSINKKESQSLNPFCPQWILESELNMELSS